MATTTGALTHRVTIQEDAGTTKRSAGSPIPSWGEFCKRWMAVEGAEVREFYAVRRRFAEATYVLVCRYDSTTKQITPKMRAINGPVLATGEPDTEAGAKLFELQGAIDPTGTKTWLHIAAKELDVG